MTSALHCGAGGGGRYSASSYNGGHACKSNKDGSIDVPFHIPLGRTINIELKIGFLLSIARLI
jgi:hypothetical protein